MELTTILNRCHRFPGFVYQRTSFSADKKNIEVTVRPRKGSAAVCSRCHLPAPGYDQLVERRFEFIPIWGSSSSFCTPCGASIADGAARVAIEEVPWGDGKRTLTKAYMIFPSPLGAPAFVEGNRRVLSHFLGQGLRCGGTCRELGAGPPGIGPDRRHRRR